MASPLIQRFRISQRLPGLNEIIDAKSTVRTVTNREGRRFKISKYDEFKRTHQDSIIWAIREWRLRPVPFQVYLFFGWFEPTAARDPDNLFAGKKFALDALVEAGILLGDRQKNIAGCMDRYAIDKERPGCVVQIVEASPAGSVHMASLWSSPSAVW